ncbi:MAG: hypothetical protein U0414_43065 [Polyangiaceae bacterium]
MLRAGRTRDAADAYADLGDSARPGAAAEAADDRRLAAEYLLLSGHIEGGVARLRDVVVDRGLVWQRSAAEAMLRSAARLAKLGALGTAPARRPARGASVARADVAFAAARGLLAVDAVRGAYFALASLAEAIACADEVRTARGLLVVGGGVLGALPGRMGQWGFDMIRDARALADRVNDVRLSGFAEVSACQAHIYAGAWEAAVNAGEAGVEMLRRGAGGVTWEIDIGLMGVIRALEELGDLAGARARIEELSRDAEQRDDRYAEVTARLYRAFHHIHEGEPDVAERETRIAAKLWVTHGYTLQSFYVDRVDAHAALYRGDLASARARLEHGLAGIREAGLRSIPIVSIDAQILAARVGLAELRARPFDGGAKQAVLTACRALEGSRRGDAPAHAEALRGALASIDLDRAGADASLERAARLFDALSMRLAAACARARTSSSSADEAMEYLRASGVTDPETWLDAMLPGRRAKAP